MALRWNVPRNPSIPGAPAEPPCRRPVSERKIQANRENALCSMGHEQSEGSGRLPATQLLTNSSRGMS